MFFLFLFPFLIALYMCIYMTLCCPAKLWKYKAKNKMSCHYSVLQSLSLVPSGQACGPQYGYMCGKQQYITGICSNVSSSFKVLNSIAPTVRGTTHTCCECTLAHSSRVNRSRSLLRRMSMLGQCLGELTSPNPTQNQWLIINTHTPYDVS